MLLNRPADSSVTYSTAHGPLVFGPRCLIMGILNVTPDSFSDGGRFAKVDDAVTRALDLAEQGADVLDIGPESTRPGATPVAPDEQIRRAIPVIERIRKRGLKMPVSIDTRSARVASAALDAGADIVNDVSAARHDRDMPRLLAQRRVPFVIMHMQGTPETMQKKPAYANVVDEVARFFIDRAEALCAAGVDVGRMIVDPGIGFGKTTVHNLALLRHLPTLGGQWPILVGVSRKKFIGELSGAVSPDDRIMGTAAAVAHCVLTGADMVRVHDVAAMRQVVRVCEAIRCAEKTDKSEARIRFPLP